LGRKNRRKKTYHTKAVGEEAKSLLGSAIDKTQATLFLIEHLEGSPYNQAQYADSLGKIKRHAIANAELAGKLLGLLSPSPDSRVSTRKSRPPRARTSSRGS
jgi:hypothetical protein